MPIFRLLEKITAIFKKLDIQYMISGSMAMNFYSVSRATRDIDIVVHMQEKDINNFIKNLTNFYFNKDTIIKETRNHGMYNIVDLETGFKIDIILLKKTDYFKEAFSNKLIKNELGFEIDVISLEDLIIAKLIWIQQLQSDRQKEDITMLLNNTKTNIEYIKKWVDTLNINTFGLV